MSDSLQDPTRALDSRPRCGWCGDDPLYRRYHDEEWGVPCRDDRHLFEMLLLEGAQAGLSWITILKRREGYRQAFDHFDPARIAAYDEAKQQLLLQDPGIIRNRAKIRAAIGNAQAFLELTSDGTRFSDFLWQFVDHRPLQNSWPDRQAVPAQTEISVALSKALKKRGFRFVGPTICYAFMQAVGMVNDHTIECFRYSELRPN